QPQQPPRRPQQPSGARPLPARTDDGPATQVVPRPSKALDDVSDEPAQAAQVAEAAQGADAEADAADAGHGTSAQTAEGESDPNEDPTRRVRARESAASSAAKERYRPAQRAGAAPQPPAGGRVPPRANGSRPAQQPAQPAVQPSAQAPAQPSAQPPAQPPSQPRFAQGGPGVTRGAPATAQARGGRDVPLTQEGERGSRGGSSSGVVASSGQGTAKSGSQTAYARTPEQGPGGSRATRAGAPEPPAEPAPEAAPAAQPIAKGPLPPMSYPEQPAGGADPAEEAGAEEPVVNPTLPPEVRDLARRPGGRRRRAGDDEAAEQSQESTGRRYRPEGEPWQVPGGAQESTGGRRRAPDPEDDEPSGSHSSGRSVSELLAAYGAGDATPRRRRRAED